ncbi:BPL-N domain-containing protein [Desulfobaculum senezii]
MSSIYIYWDESHLWGLLAWRAIKSWGLPYRLVRGDEIADGILSTDPPKLLLVPGGWARAKYDLLGEQGVSEVRRYVRHGGNYLGFCGGTGLALSGPYGLGLCPWKRRAFTDRLQHACSGHMFTNVEASSDLVPGRLPEQPLIPVWWPARFEYQPHEDITVLASYSTPGPDFWVADLPLENVPKQPLSDLESQYGIRIWPEFMTDQPCIIEGKFGQGRYMLSYAHLETPASVDANHWLSHILYTMTGEEPAGGVLSVLPAWNLERLPRRWPDEDGGEALAAVKAALEDIIALGMDHLLLFRRNSWLLGWRRGIPGGYINFLYSMACQAQNLTPTKEAAEYWKASCDKFLEDMDHFRHGLAGYLLAERLAMSVPESSGDIPSDSLREQRIALFGQHMNYGGMYAKLVRVLDKVLWLTLRYGPS